MATELNDEGRLFQICPKCSNEVETNSTEVASYIQKYGCDDCRLDNPEDKKLLKPPQLMMAISITRRKLYDLVHRRRIPHYRIGRELRFDLNEVLKAMRDNAENN